MNNPSQNPGTSFEGTWDCIIATPMGKEANELVLRAGPDNTLSGEMKSVKDGNTISLQDGRYNNNVLNWTLQLTKPFPITLKVEVQVNGNELAGHASAGMMGKVPLSGTRRA